MAPAGLDASGASWKKIQEANDALSEGNCSIAVLFLTEAIDLCPENVEYVLNRGSALLEKKLSRETMGGAVLSVSQNSGTVEAYVSAANYHQGHGNFVIAQNILQDLLSQSSVTGDTVDKIEQILLSLRKLRMDAIRILKLYLEHHYAEANSACDQLLSMAPECYSAILIKCLALTVMGHTGEAEPLVDELLDVNPCNNDALFAKAQILYYTEKYKEANLILEQISESPLLGMGDLVLSKKASMLSFIRTKESAQNAVLRKDYEAAVKLHEDALKIDVTHKLGNSKIHLILSIINARQDNLFKALDHCEQAVSLDPLNEKAIKKRIDLLEKLTFVDEALSQAEQLYSSLKSDDDSEIVRLKEKQKLLKSEGHYFILSVSPSATEAEIHAAYNKKLSYFAKFDQLDVIADKVKLKRKQVDQAYSVLKDKKKRVVYNRQVGISKTCPDLSDSDDELLAELKSFSTSTKLQSGISQNGFGSVTSNDVTQNGSNGDTKKEDSERENDSLVDSSDLETDDEGAELQQPEMSPVEKEAQLKHSDGIQRLNENLFLVAIQDFTDAIALCAKNGQYYLSRSDAYLKIHRYPEAIEDAWKSVEFDGNSVKSYLQILKCTLLVGDILRAEDIVGCLQALDEATYKRWSQRLDWFKAAIEDAKKQFVAFNYRTTIVHCDAILEKSPAFVQIQLLKAEALSHLNIFEPAEHIAKKLTDCVEAGSGVLYIRGLLAYYNDHLGSALEIFSDLQANAHRPHLKAKTQVMRIELLKSKVADANEAFKSSRYDEACNKYTEALSIDRNFKSRNAKLYLNRAETKLILGQTDEARLDCDESIACIPEYLEAYKRRAEIHMKLAMYEEAVADWEVVCETDLSAASHKRLDTARKMAEVKREPCDILGVGAVSAEHVILQARDRLTQLHHRDRHVTEAIPIQKMHDRKFKAVLEAFNALMGNKAEASGPRSHTNDLPESKANRYAMYGDDCQVYVTGLDKEVTREELRRKMAEHGEVILVSIRDIGETFRYAFVTFAKPETALESSV
ncbi:DnaJ -like protein subfamily C member 7 [Halotydeus destructor]|nr:DnaJ -like protein subfamily C member 7 [Halotydeus destructor]